ncbi:LOW QUALITY PROTEIN: probable dipeptidyl-aminopeptidase B [Thrips palmi]|uniref:Venom dipeptidyl peptidase 4 n=1 Tax=Thrips palmi TaxID=161013 RepID=A0A6P8ZNX0_THRPL|nr:LOW QUALITY PROTEIN: probable dipeptidyl-aminopeptidase B [Thrips palmi]
MTGAGSGSGSGAGQPDKAPVKDDSQTGASTASDNKATTSNNNNNNKRVVLMPDKEELVAASPAQRNWRGILIALLVIVAVLGLIMFSIVLLSPPDEGQRYKGEKLTLKDLTEDLFLAPPFNGTWISDVELVYRDANNGLSVLNAVTLHSRVIMTNSTFRQLNAVDFKVSRDLKFVLLISEKRRVFDYSYEAKYTVFEVATQTRYPLRVNESDEPGGGAAGAKWLQLVDWGPTGSQLVLVQDNDIYYKANGSTQARAVRLTSSGKRGVVFNGIPDWLYEVEILRSDRAIWISPDSKYMLFASFNDSRVGELKYPYYGSLQEGLRYPKINTLRYPKAGTPNPEVALRLLTLDGSGGVGQAPVELKPPPCITNRESDYYFTAVTWIDSQSFSVVWMNRRQNLSCVSVCRWSSWNCDDVYDDQSPFWVDVYQPPVFSADGTQLVARLPVNDGEQGSFRQVVQVAVSGGGSGAGALAATSLTPLTYGPMHVTEVLAWDEENHLVYFVAAPSYAPDQRHLYRVPDAKGAAAAAGWTGTATGTATASGPAGLTATAAPNGAPNGAAGPTWQCLTCPPCPPPAPVLEPGQEEAAVVEDDDLPIPEATATAAPVNATSSNETLWDWQWGNPGSAVCLFSHAHFPPGRRLRFYILECQGPEVPEAILVNATSNLPLLSLQHNSRLRDMFNKRARPQIKTFKVQIDNDYHAQVRLFLPPGLRDYEEVTFPLVLHVDAAPGSQLVSQRWAVDYSAYLASNRNYIVAEIDGRGSGFQSDRFLFEPYRRLGSVELEDQIAIVKYLSDKLKYVDRDRVGLWGRGYGGFSTAMILSEDRSPGVFACGIAVAPVTNWAHYDSVFAERYLCTPNVTDNYRGYEDADVSKKAGNLRDKRFLLIHGTADLRAHYTQSMLLVRALAREGALFQHQTYPDEGHDLRGVRDHMYRTMDAFWDDCFGPLDLEDWEDGVGLFSFKQ